MEESIVPPPAPLFYTAYGLESGKKSQQNGREMKPGKREKMGVFGKMSFHGTAWKTTGSHKRGALPQIEVLKIGYRIVLTTGNQAGCNTFTLKHTYTHTHAQIHTHTHTQVEMLRKQVFFSSREVMKSACSVVMVLQH